MAIHNFIANEKAVSLDEKNAEKINKIISNTLNKIIVLYSVLLLSATLPKKNNEYLSELKVTTPPINVIFQL